MKPSNKKQWFNVIEFLVLGAAIWLGPSASFFHFLLKTCFQILAALQTEEPQQKP